MTGQQITGPVSSSAIEFVSTSLIGAMAPMPAAVHMLTVSRHEDPRI
jgi:hypothetical protein